MPIDRDRRKLIEQLLEMVTAEDAATIEAVVAQTEILLRVKARATRSPRTRA
jgi:hypothetical protein